MLSLIFLILEQTLPPTHTHHYWKELYTSNKKQNINKKNRHFLLYRRCLKISIGPNMDLSYLRMLWEVNPEGQSMNGLSITQGPQKQALHSSVGKRLSERAACDSSQLLGVQRSLCPAVTHWIQNWSTPPRQPRSTALPQRELAGCQLPQFPWIQAPPSNSFTTRFRNSYCILSFILVTL